MTSGLDQNRLSLLLAVLEKRAGLNLIAEDVFVNVAGGMAIDEPAADLAIVAAVASSVRNRPIKPATAVFGEVGLAGEVRGISQAPLRLREAAQMGFTRCIVPNGNCAPEDAPAGCEVVAVKKCRKRSTSSWTGNRIAVASVVSRSLVGVVVNRSRSAASDSGSRITD